MAQMTSLHSMSVSHGSQDTVEHGNGDKNRTKRRRKPVQRDTHFLCFPLVTKVSVPQLAQSLAHFRHVTSLNQSPQAQRDTPDGVDVNVVVGDDEGGDSTSPESKLRILPEEAFRPPGTFHLTLGVMDLSTTQRMQQALKLLQGMDLRSMLADISMNVPNDLNSNEVRHQRSKVSEPGTAVTAGQPKEREEGLPSSLARSISPPSIPHPRMSTNTDPDTQGARAEDIGGLSNTKGTIDPGNRPQTEGLFISLTGLSTFSSPASARVLYANPQDPTNRLHDFAVTIRQRFRSAGLITETRPLVLHATVGNLRYAVTAKAGTKASINDSSKKGGGWKGKKQAWKEHGQIDARELVQLFDIYGGHVDEYTKGESVRSVAHGDGQKIRTSENEQDTKIESEAEAEADTENRLRGEFVWATDVSVDQLAICKLGATKSDDPVLGLEYPPIASNWIFGGG